MATKPTVWVYTKPACVQANATYKALDKYKIPYEVIDISQSIALQDFLVARHTLQAPVVYVVCQAPPHEE